MTLGVGALWDSADEAARAAKLAAYERAWGLIPDGEPFSTHSSWLAPVRAGAAPAMLKIPCHPEERAAMAALAWYRGEGAADVLRIDDEAVLMQRLADDRPLKAMAEGGRDDEATAILVGAAQALHGIRDRPFPAKAPTLRRWFRALSEQALKDHSTGVIRAGWQIAEPMLEGPDDLVLLHGDIHHDNVLHDPSRGWAIIDPKGIVGPTGYDYANMLCNPFGDLPLKPGRMAAQAKVISAITGRSMASILSWVIAYSALSASWYLESHEDQATNALNFCREAQRVLAEARA